MLVYDNFVGCGFPEQYLFWFIVISAPFAMLSYVVLHSHVNDDIERKGFFPIVVLVFYKDGFKGKGIFFQKIFLLSIAVCLLSFACLMLGYELGFLSCGHFGE